MLKSILNLDGVTLLSKKEQKNCVGSVYVADKICRKNIGIMVYPGGGLVEASYFACYDPALQAYTYYNVLGNEITCP